MKRVLLLVGALMLVASAQATITGYALGSGGMVGSRPLPAGFTWAMADTDPSGVFGDVTSVPGWSAWGATPITFSIPMSHRQAPGGGWATWSGGGILVDVYYTNGSTSMTIGVPSGLAGFAFYAEPNPFSWQTITATAQDGTSVSQSVLGASGAAGYAFTSTALSEIVSISVTGTSDFAIGEFYGAVPEPASLSLLGLAGLFVLRRR